jgi:hypothetical protein
MYASHDNKLSIMERMVELGADVNAVNKVSVYYLNIIDKTSTAIIIIMTMVR